MLMNISVKMVPTKLTYEIAAEKRRLNLNTDNRPGTQKESI